MPVLVWGTTNICDLFGGNLKPNFNRFRLSVYLLLLGPAIAFAQNGQQVFNSDVLHEIRISFFAQTNFWETLNSNYQAFSSFSGSDIPYLEGSISIDGTLLESVGIRLKGKSSYYYANDQKKPFKIDFNEFVAGQKFDGLKKINLQNGIGDPGMLRDFLAFDMMRKIGIAAPRVSYCKLFINDEFWGLYEIIEQIDQTFLKDNFSKGSGNLYKNQRWSSLEWWGEDPNIYRDTFELKTNVEENDWSRFVDLLDVLNNTPDATFETDFSRIFNIDYFLHVLAVDLFINNWDSYISNSRNFYIYDDPGSGKFHWIPWDYNLSQGGDLDTHGDPFPPYDENCVEKTDFIFTQDEKKITFQSYAEPFAHRYIWDFGDGNQSVDAHPVHEYVDVGVYNVCLTAQRDQGSDQCQQTRCKKVNLNFNPGNCSSIQDGSSPYDSSDPIFQQVIAQDEFCCSDEWDVFCQITYNDLQINPPFEIEEGTSYQRDFPLLHTTNPKKVLINRLLNIDHVKEKYLKICCLLRENYFNESYLFPRIENQSDLIRNSVYEDHNFLYTTDYFEYDTGNGTGGGSDAYIPSLKYFYQNRFDQIDEYIYESSFDCSRANNELEFQDVVINEFMAASDEEGIITDPNGEVEDWIELYNNSSLPVDLSDYYLSDDLDRPLKWTFPSGTMLPGNGYLIIWADNDLQEEGLHANFKLAAIGEQIIFSHEDGSVIDLVNYQEQQINQSSARYPNGHGVFEQGAITFNQFNGTTGVDDLIKSEFLNVYPNPASNYFFIEIPEEFISKEYSLKMWNSIGEKQYPETTKMQNGKLQVLLDGHRIVPGIFRIELTNGNEIYNHKLIIY